MTDWAGTRVGGRGGHVLDEIGTRGWLVLTPRRRAGEEEPDDAGVDHVVVGPTGAFVLDVKDWQGSITVRNDLLRVDERSRDRFVRETVSLVEELAAVVPADLRAHVHPVVVLDRTEPLLLTTRDVLVCSWASLVAALTRRATVWGPSHVAFAAVMLRSRLDPDDADALHDGFVPELPRRADVLTADSRPRS